MRPYSAGQQIENLGEYAVDAVDKDSPDATQFADGALPRATLPAKWWNWFTGKFTKNISQSSLAFEDLYGELLDLFTKAGVTPGVTGATSPQLHSVLSLLFYGASDPANRYITVNKTIDYTKAHVEKLLVATAGVIITFPSIDAISDPPYKKADIVNVSSGDITVALGGSGLSNVTLPPGAMMSVFCTRIPAGTYTWRHSWAYLNQLVGGANGYKATELNGVDLDTIRTSGFYTVSTCTNRPEAVAGYMFVIGVSSSYAVQVWFSQAADTTYFRRQTGSANAPWIKLWSAANGGSGSGMDADKLDGYHASMTADVSKVVVRDAAGRAKVVAPAAADDVALKSTVTADIGTHAALTAAGTHGSATAASANTIVHRDATGRAKVVAPLAEDDIALKSNVTTVASALSTHEGLTAAGVHGSATAATANTLVHRDAAGRAKVVAPSAEDDIALKSNVTTVATALSNHEANTTTAHGAVSAATASKFMVRDASARAAVADPSAMADIATRGWVEKIFNRMTDFVVARVATTANLDLNGLETIDGISLSLSDRVLVKNQSTTSQNGIWVVQSAGWTRAGDFDADVEIANKVITITEGTANGGKAFMAVAELNAISVPSTIQFYEINMTQYAKAGRLILRDANGRAQVTGAGASADIAIMSDVTGAVSAEATLARNADYLTSGTVHLNRIPTTLTGKTAEHASIADDVYAWAKAATLASGTVTGALGFTPDAAGTARPASDVYTWAKASVKPTYTKSEVGLGSVDNTADSAKSVSYAATAGSAPANGGTSAACSGNAATATNADKVDGIHMVAQTAQPTGVEGLLWLKI